MTQRRLLLVTGGTWHDMDGAADRIVRAFAPLAACEVAGPDALRTGVLRGFDAFALYTCLAAEDDGLKDKTAASLPPDARAAVEGFVEGGGAFLPLHATICSFTDWEGLGRMMGARWTWFESAHDPFGAFTVRVRGGHPLGAGLGDFEVRDELYHTLRMHRPVDVLLEAERRGVMEPHAWTAAFGGGKVFCFLPGHTPETLGLTPIQELLRRGLAWALGGWFTARERRN